MTVGDTFRIETQSDLVIVHLAGEIDLANASTIGSVASGAVPNDAAGVVLDLTGVTYLDSSGVHLVFDLAQRLRERQQRLVLVVPDESRIRRVLDLVNLRAVVPVVTTVDEASAELRRSQTPG